MDDMRIIGRRAGLFLLILSVGILAACGGGGGSSGAAAPADDTANPPADGPGFPPADDPADDPADPGPDVVETTIESWSPLFATDGNGAPVVPVWTYRVNGGEPLAVSAYGTNGTLDFEAPLTVTFDPELDRRISILPFSFMGTVDTSPAALEGHGIIDVSEQFLIEGDEVRLGDRMHVLTLDAHSDDTSIGVQAMSMVSVETPLDWFPAHLDFGGLPVGAQSGPEHDVEGTITGMVAAFEPGVDPAGTEFGATVASRQSWEIVARHETFEVLGRVYREVVVVELWSVTPDLRAPEDGPETASSWPVRIWFAKGIGMIRAEGLFRIYRQSVDVELIETNLEK